MHYLFTFFVIFFRFIFITIFIDLCLVGFSKWYIYIFFIYSLQWRSMYSIHVQPNNIYIWIEKSCVEMIEAAIAIEYLNWFCCSIFFLFFILNSNANIIFLVSCSSYELLIFSSQLLWEHYIAESKKKNENPTFNAEILKCATYANTLISISFICIH